MQLQNAVPAPGKAQPEFKVRLAVEADIPAMLAMGRALHMENGLMPISDRRIMQMAFRIINRDNIVAGVIGPAGNPEAMICLVVGQYWYSDQPHLEEIFSYVLPQYRKSARAKYLIEYAKSCADELNAPLIIGILSNQRTEAKVALYKRRLGKPAGAYFLYRGKTGM